MRNGSIATSPSERDVVEGADTTDGDGAGEQSQMAVREDAEGR